MCSHYNTGPYLNFPHFGNRNLGKLPHDFGVAVSAVCPELNIIIVVEEVAVAAAVALVVVVAISNLSSVDWIAVKEFKLSYYIGETLLFTIYTHYGNLI